jgi:molybdopterin converting factor small subunit
MSKVKVTQFVTDAAFRNEEIEVGEETTVQDLIRALGKNYDGFENDLIDPKTRELQYGIIVAINQVDVRVLQGLKTRVRDGDSIAFYPFISGG